MKITDTIIQIGIKEEAEFFRTKSPDVNMRLFRSSDGYREVVLTAIRHMESHLKTIFEDYSNVRSVSAAKLGISWNIIAYKDTTNVIRICINPRYIEKHIKNTREVDTKCPSIDLHKQHKVSRMINFDMEFYDINGHKVLQRGIAQTDSGFAIQHEVNHSLGICPGDEKSSKTDKVVSFFGNC